MAQVEIQHVFRARGGGLVTIADEAEVRALVDRFGHATTIEPVDLGEAGRALRVTVRFERGPTGASTLHDLACRAGLLAAVV